MKEHHLILAQACTLPSSSDLGEVAIDLVISRFSTKTMTHSLHCHWLSCRIAQIQTLILVQVLCASSADATIPLAPPETAALGDKISVSG